MCLTNFLVQPHNVIAMEPTKGSSDTRRGPAQNFMNHERRTHQERIFNSFKTPVGEQQSTKLVFVGTQIAEKEAM
jgi:hypothetical protein